MNTTGLNEKTTFLTGFGITAVVFSEKGVLGYFFGGVTSPALILSKNSGVSLAKIG